MLKDLSKTEPTNDNAILNLALPIIQKWENCKKKLPDGRIEAYWDNIGMIWTIGWGTCFYPSGQAVKKTDTITQKQADKYLYDNAARYLTRLKKAIPKATTKQYAALLSFQYNLGPGIFDKASTTLDELHNTGKHTEVTKKMLQYSFAKGVWIKGLNNRRQDEAALYIS